MADTDDARSNDCFCNLPGDAMTAAGLTKIPASLQRSYAAKLQRVHSKEKAATAGGTSGTDDAVRCRLRVRSNEPLAVAARLDLAAELLRHEAAEPSISRLASQCATPVRVTVAMPGKRLTLAA